MYYLWKVFTVTAEIGLGPRGVPVTVRLKFCWMSFGFLLNCQHCCWLASLGFPKVKFKPGPWPA